MKNKLGVDFVASEKFDGDLPVNEVGQRRGTKTNTRRGSITPKIVVCPPVEDMSKSVAPPREGRLLKALTKRLSRRETDIESIGSSSSNDSIWGEQGKSDDHSSSSPSECSSGADQHHRHRSTVSLSRVFETLNLKRRSLSSSPTERSQRKKQQQPKRILRPPVTYTYVRGLSGLPTQRIPRHKVSYNTSGLNR